MRLDRETLDRMLAVPGAKLSPTVGESLGRPEAKPAFVQLPGRLEPTDGSGAVWLRIFIPGLKLVSLTNQREHWRTRSRRAKEHRAAVRSAVDAAGLGLLIARAPTLVAMTYWFRGPKMDSDNLESALKHVRDGVAEWLRVDDGSPDIVFLRPLMYRAGNGRATGVGVAVKTAGVEGGC